MLVAVNFAVYAAQFFNPSITAAGAKVNSAILVQKQWYRLVTPVFLHGSVGHLLTNSFSLWQTGPSLERFFGERRFLATYFLAGVAGNCFSLRFSPSMSVGASGAIAGLVGAMAVYLRRHDWLYGPQGDRMLRNMGQVVAINAYYGLTASNIDNWGHLGGLLGGAAAAYTFGPRYRPVHDQLGQVLGISDYPLVEVPGITRGFGKRKKRGIRYFRGAPR